MPACSPEEEAAGETSDMTESMLEVRLSPPQVGPVAGGMVNGEPVPDAASFSLPSKSMGRMRLGEGSPLPHEGGVRRLGVSSGEAAILSSSFAASCALSIRRIGRTVAAVRLVHRLL